MQPSTTILCSSSLVGQVAHLDHVRHVGCATSLNAETLTSNGGLGTYLLTRVELVASTDGLFTRQDRVSITQGRSADPARTDEIVVNAAAAAYLHLGVGSHLLVGVDTSNQQNIVPPYRTIDLTVVGEGVFDTQVVQDDIDKGHTGFLLGTAALARELAPCCTGLTYDGVQLTGDRYDAAFEREYEHLLSSGTTAVNANSQQLQVYASSVIESEAQRAIRPEAIALGVFGFIATLAALLIAVQSISRQVRADADDMEVLRALGAGPSTTTAGSLLGIVVAIVLGSLSAVVVAIGLSPLTLFGPVRVVDASPGIRPVAVVPLRPPAVGGRRPDGPRRIRGVRRRRCPGARQRRRGGARALCGHDANRSPATR